MQAVRSYLEKKIVEGEEEHKVLLLEVLVKREEDLCLVEEIDREEILFILERSKACDERLGQVLGLLEEIDYQEIQEDLQSLADHVRQVSFLTSPILVLTLKEDVFFYSLGKYKKRISKESTLTILEHAFTRGEHFYP
ncbi:Hypothetical protein BQ3484_86 [Cedratvirus A11]|uniref:Uncharacterized protein n=1 Tax=Cedratvirus A11 TaxID=1903266 RepID=A0A1M7XTZ4_9VIRU|nr:Hypothetical protein BQ3484_86 [Cedratvirus A11]SHO33154.1 Hypothetical protein BQ3484_86 [Cedratvirus A11]